MTLDPDDGIPARANLLAWRSSNYVLLPHIRIRIRIRIQMPLRGSAHPVAPVHDRSVSRPEAIAMRHADSSQNASCAAWSLAAGLA